MTKKQLAKKIIELSKKANEAVPSDVYYEIGDLGNALKSALENKDNSVLDKIYSSDKDVLMSEYKKNPGNDELFNLIVDRVDGDEKVKVMYQYYTKNPQNMDVAKELADKYFSDREKYKTNALPIYEKFLDNASADDETKMKLGVLYFEDDNYSKAKKHLLDIQGFYKNNSTINYYLGKIFQSENDKAKAIDYFYDAYQFDDSYVDAVRFIAENAEDAKKYDEGINSLKFLINKFPEKRVNYIKLGKLYKLNNDLENAVINYMVCLKKGFYIDEELEGVFSYLINKNSYDDILDIENKCEYSDEFDTNIRTTVLRAYIEKNRKKDAKKYADKCINDGYSNNFIKQIAQGIHFEESTKSASQNRCNYCGVVFEEDEDIRKCNSCKATYHTYCWEDNGNCCSTYGCSSTSAQEEVNK